MPTIEIPFGEWLPDRPSYKNPGCEIADNVVPTPGGYGPFLAFQGVGQSTTEAVRGAQQYYDNTGASVLVGGSDTRLFIRRSAITETSGLASIGSDEAWDFARYNDFVFAASANNPLQYLADIDSTDVWAASPGSPPVAKRVAKVGEFLMLGSTVDGPNWIEWSPYNNPTGTWGQNRRTQAGKNPMPAEYGEVMRIIGGRYPMVFQERGISRLSYVGPPNVWRRDDITQERGTLAPFSVVQLGFLNYFLARDGFFVTNGSEVQSISSSRVTKRFFEEVDQTTLYQVQGAVDWENETIVWSFSSDGTTLDRKFIYSPVLNRWSSATVTTEWITSSQTDAQTLEDVGVTYPTLESVPISLDARFWSATNQTLGAFVGQEYGLFAGDPIFAKLRIGSSQPVPMKRVHVSEVMPLLDGDLRDEKFQLFLYDNQNQRTVTPQVQCGNQGYAPVMGEGYRMEVELIKPGGMAWRDAQGVHVRYELAGGS